MAGTKGTKGAKTAKTASDLVRRGYPHGRRASRPSPNSGGLTMVNRPGSSKFHRYTERRTKR